MNLHALRKLKTHCITSAVLVQPNRRFLRFAATNEVARPSRRVPRSEAREEILPVFLVLTDCVARKVARLQCRQKSTGGFTLRQVRLHKNPCWEE